MARYLPCLLVKDEDGVPLLAVACWWASSRAKAGWLADEARTTLDRGSCCCLGSGPEGRQPNSQGDVSMIVRYSIYADNPLWIPNLGAVSFIYHRRSKTL